MYIKLLRGERERKVREYIEARADELFRVAAAAAAAGVWI